MWTFHTISKKVRKKKTGQTLFICNTPTKNDYPMQCLEQKKIQSIMQLVLLQDRKLGDRHTFLTPQTPSWHSLKKTGSCKRNKHLLEYCKMKNKLKDVIRATHSVNDYTWSSLHNFSFKINFINPVSYHFFIGNFWSKNTAHLTKVWCTNLKYMKNHLWKEFLVKSRR